MKTELILELAAASGVTVTVGLVNQVHQYAMEDVMHLKKYGQLMQNHCVLSLFKLFYAIV